LQNKNLYQTVIEDQSHKVTFNLLKTMSLSCTVFELYGVICRKWLILSYPVCIWHPRRGWSRSNFTMIFGIRKLESLGCVICLFV